MLMHHPDSEFVRDIRIRDSHVLAVDFDYATVRLIHAKQDTHQGGLARSVLTERMNLALLQPNRNIVIGYDPGNSLRMPTISTT